MVFEYCSEGHYALLRAVEAGRPRQVRLLLESGVGVHYTDACGQTPLIRAMFIQNSRQRQKIVRILLRRRALVSHQDYYGRSALAWACLHGLDDVLEQLMKHSDGELDLNDTDLNDCTPLFHAATSGSAAMVKLLIDSLQKYGLSVDVVNKDGLTPLMQAIRLGNDVCASILLNQGKASVTVRDNKHRSALDWAEATSKQSQIKTNFLPLIKHAAREPSARRPGRRYAYSGNDSDSDNETRCPSDHSVERNTHDEGDEGSEFSDIKSTCSSAYSSQTSGSSSSCESSPEVFRKILRNVPPTYKSIAEDCRSVRVSSSPDREDCDSSSHPVNNDDHSGLGQYQIKKYHNLPDIYRLLSAQLTDTFRAGATRQRESSASPEPGHEDCRLECCVPQGGAPSLSEERLQKMVHANMKAKDAGTSSRLSSPRSGSAASRRSPQSSRLPSLRRQVTRKRFFESNLQHDQHDDMNRKHNAEHTNSHHHSDLSHTPSHTPASSPTAVDHKSNFPAIAKGKTSLVSSSPEGAEEKSTGVLKKDIDMILSSSVHYLSL